MTLLDALRSNRPMRRWLLVVTLVGCGSGPAMDLLPLPDADGVRWDFQPSPSLTDDAGTGGGAGGAGGGGQPDAAASGGAGGTGVQQARDSGALDTAPAAADTRQQDTGSPEPPRACTGSQTIERCMRGDPDSDVVYFAVSRATGLRCATCKSTATGVAYNSCRPQNSPEYLCVSSCQAKPPGGEIYDCCYKVGETCSSSSDCCSGRCVRKSVLKSVCE